MENSMLPRGAELRLTISSLRESLQEEQESSDIQEEQQRPPQPEIDSNVNGDNPGIINGDQEQDDINIIEINPNSNLGMPLPAPPPVLVEPEPELDPNDDDNNNNNQKKEGSTPVSTNNNDIPPKDKAPITIYTLPDLTNDENAPIKLPSYNSYMNDEGQFQSSAIYCGRYFGTDIIPQSDGRCGPDDGPSCPSCIRLREKDYKSKRDILKRLFPGLYVLFSDRSDSTRGWLDVDAPLDDGENIVDLEKHCGYLINNNEGDDDDDDDKSNSLDTYLIHMLRKHHGHFGRCVLGIKMEYCELQRECNLSFKFPDTSNDSTDDDDHDNDDESELAAMIENIGAEIALSEPFHRPPKTTHYNTNIQTICEITSITTALAEYLYHEMGYDIDETIEHIMTEGLNAYDATSDTEEQEEDVLMRYVRLMTEMEDYFNKKEDEIKALTKRRNEHISYAVEHAKELVTKDIVVRRMKELKDSLNTKMKFEPLCDDEEGQKPSMIPIRGHRMVLTTKENPFNCRICTSQVPSKEGGHYYSEQCNLCEGCVQTPYSSLELEENSDDEDEEEIGRGDYDYLHCPMNLNGGHLYHQPLKPAYDKRSHCVCDICEYHCKSIESHDIVWYNEESDFDVCIDCFHRPPPKNYCRTKNEIVHSCRGDEETFALNAIISLFGNDADDELDVENDNQRRDASDDKNNEEPQLVIAHNFNKTAIESDVAAHWEVRQPDNRLDHGIFLGSGTIGNTSEETSSSSSSTSTTDVRTPIPILGNDGNLPNEAMNALHILEQPSIDVGLRSAADIAQAEDILRCVAPTVQTEGNSSYNTMLDCISAGKIGLAGSLLLSHSYAPFCLPCTDSNENSEEKQNTNEELTCCCCFETINQGTAPDGAVGCLGGHSMHAACASDLLLGGGKCPTCRQTLFYSKVAESEVKVAAKFTKDEIDRIRTEAEEKVKKELSILARDGLPINFKVGDVVCIPDDTDYCKRIQCEDPSSGWWHDDMVSGCGLEGSVTDIITDSENQAVSIRVKSSYLHKFEVVRRIDDFECKECNANPIGLRYCINCNECEMCCRQNGDECSNQSNEWYWNPSLLTLLRRYNGSSPLVLVANSEVCKSEQHILRLKSELVAVKSAREAVKENMNELLASQVKLKTPGRIGRQLTQNSNEAIATIANEGIAPPDLQRARHILTLANQWGQSDKAKSKRAELYEAVREGQLDSVARIVRRYNAEQTAEAARWADASNATSEYVVEPWALVDLRVFPNSNSPRMGINLKPNTKFFSAEEILDQDGNMWVKIDPQSVEIEKDNAPLPQGWIRIRPGGDGFAPVVRKKRSCLKCFCCGEGLIPPTPAHGKYEVAQQSKVKVGDILLVSSTLEKVKVKSIDEKYIKCSYFTKANDDEDHTYASFLYRPCDLVVPKFGTTGDGLDENLLVNGRLRNRRELVLSHHGDEERARNDWHVAKKKEDYYEQEFASCTRGHLLHSRCLQQALMNGSRCPAPGCMEQLFLPKITRARNNDDDTCCGGNSSNDEEIEALRAVEELSGHSARLEVGTHNSITENNARELFKNKRLKMCPLCYSGPLVNQNCSDMSAHHGQCSTRALGGNDKRPCTENGDFRVSASDIAARMTQVSPNKSVADLLHRCPTHNCLVMFNGCMNCGHCFTDIDWNDLPDWNPKARAYLDLDKKRRNAARLLAEQIRSEASQLQFERDAFCEANGNASFNGKSSGGWSGSSIDKIIEPPSPRSKEGTRKEELRTVYVSPPSKIY